MASISSPGLGSGIDVASLVTQLVAAEGQAPTTRLDRREAELQARLSAYGSLKGSFSALETSLAALKSATTFQNKSAASSDTDVATANSSSSAAVASYSLDVTNLAAQQRLATDPGLANAKFTSLNDVVGTGTLTFRFGTTDYVDSPESYNAFTQNAEKPSKSVEITDGSLTGIRDAINKAEIGVDASLIFDGTNYRLLLSSTDTGSANSLEISVDDADLDDADTAGLSLLSFNQTSNNFKQTQAAADAALNINGIDIVSASNTLNDTIDGLTLNLVKAGTTTISVAQDSDAVSANIGSFVAKYNALIGTINDLSRYDAESQSAGVLNGDSVLRSLDNQVRGILGNPLTGTNGSFSILAEIGISRSAKDGTLVLDNSALEDAINDDLEGVISLFAAYGKTTDSQIKFNDSGIASQAGNHLINITQLASLGQAVGSAAANLTITAGVNDVLALTVDGTASSITLSAGTYTAASLTAELQAKINGDASFSAADIAVTVSEDAGVLSIISNRYGSASNVKSLGGNAFTDLLGGAPVSTDGVDVAGTIGGFEATGSGQVLTGTNAVTGLAITVEGGAVGSRGNIAFSRGYSEQLENFIDSILKSDGIFAGVESSINSQIERIGGDRENLALRLTALETRLRAQFTGLDILVSQLQNTSNFLQQQLAAIPVIGRTSSNR